MSIISSILTFHSLVFSHFSSLSLSLSVSPIQLQKAETSTYFNPIIQHFHGHLPFFLNLISFSFLFTIMSTYYHDHSHHETITLYGHPQLKQGLSLSLSTLNPGPADRLTQPGVSIAGGGHNLVLESKYLKPAQELLVEVVHVGDRPGSRRGPKNGVGESLQERESSVGVGGQMSSGERQELEMKKLKLMNMLDETDQRYNLYHNQIQNMIKSFEQIAGIGSAKAYTALALKTISRQFRWLKDMIQVQIKTTKKRLGEEELGGLGSLVGKSEGSKLKYVDHQTRQQQAMRQLGMVQNPNAWRSQRGLPETSVSVLRAWLFEHFLHPYPKDSDKVMLAKKTGLSRGQVSNWFINARVRLWKPMIEDMYKEETKDQEQNELDNKTNSNESDYDTNQDEKLDVSDQVQVNDSLKDQNPSSVASPSPSPSLISIPLLKGNNNNLPLNQHGVSFTNSLEMEGISQGNKRPRIADKGYPFISGAMTFVGGNEVESYPKIGELGRFETEELPYLPSNRVSLSLGLPPYENQHHQQLNLSETDHTFLSLDQSIQFRQPNRFDSMNNLSTHSSATAFECIDIENRKGFGAQLLPDFVA